MTPVAGNGLDKHGPRGSVRMRLAHGLLVGMLCPFVLLPGQAVCQAEPKEESLPPIPLPTGLAGTFAGVSNGTLIIAGGTSFTDPERARPAQNWHDDVFFLESGKADWQTGPRLPKPLAHGVSITTDFGLLVIGGRNRQEVCPEVLLLRRGLDGIEISRLPDLPEPRAAAAGALLGDAIYVAGGQSEIAGQEVAHTLWKLELPKKQEKISWNELRWETLEGWPGAPRAGALAAGQAGNLYLFGGWTLIPGPDGQPKRIYLHDAYRYAPRTQTWTRVADLPDPSLARAPALAVGESHVLVFGGHDAHDAPDEGRTCRDIFAYHTITNTWTRMGTLPLRLWATNAVHRQGQIVIPGGQIGPRATTNQLYRVELHRTKPAFGTINASVLGLYLLALVGMGFFFARREKSTADFFIGGRRVPWWAAGVSILGTQLSSISFMAIPAKTYDTDWAYFVIILCIVAVQPIVVFFYLPFFRRLNVTSAYEYLEKRFNVAARLFGSASFVLFQAGRMTIVLFLPALALAAVTDLDIYTCIIAMGVLATLYTALGGIEAVVWTDVLQVFVLAGGALLSLVIICFSVEGGVETVVKIGQTDGKFNWANLGWDYTMPVLWVIIVGSVFQNLISYSADQAVIQRYLTTRDEKTAARAIWTSAVLVVPLSFVWYGLGTALYAFYKTHPDSLDPTLKTDQIFPLFIAQQLPPGVVGLVIAGLFAASMSTLDSSLNSISTAIVTDFYRRWRPSAEDSACLKLARVLTILLGLAATATALAMAANQEKIRSLWDVYLAVLGLLMGSLTGMLALGVFTRRANAAGALVGALSGAAVLYCVQQFTLISFFLYAAVGVAASFVIGYLASLVLPGKKKSLAGLTVHTLGRHNESDE